MKSKIKSKSNNHKISKRQENNNNHNANSKQIKDRYFSNNIHSTQKTSKTKITYKSIKKN